MAMQPESAADSAESTVTTDEERSDGEGVPPGTESSTTQLSKDLIFELLQVYRRRETLNYLRENGGAARLDEVAEHIAALENDTEEELLSSSQRKRVYIALYQCHLPKMDDASVIDYDQARGTIELTPVADQLFSYLDFEPGADRPDDRSILLRAVEWFQS